MSRERRWWSRWSGAEAALALAWGAFATGLLAAALARDSLGTLLLAVFCALAVVRRVWTAVPSAAPRDAARAARAADRVASGPAPREVGVPPRRAGWSLP